MKTNVVILLCSLLMLGVSTNAAAKSKKHRQTTVFNVSIHCSACQEKIEKNIAFERGVKDMLVDVDAKTVTITYDTRKTSADKLVEAFKEIGYEAAPQSTGSACGKKGDCSKAKDKAKCEAAKSEAKSKCDKPCDGKEKEHCCDKKEEKHCCDKKTD